MYRLKNALCTFQLRENILLYIFSAFMFRYFYIFAEPLTLNLPLEELL